MNVDPMEVIAALGGAGLMGAVSAIGTTWLRERSKDRRAEREAEKEAEKIATDAAASVERSRIIKAERLEIAKLSKDERTEERLWARLEAVEEETKRCHDERAADRQAYEERAIKQRAECDAEIAEVRGEVVGIAARLAKTMRARGFDDTGVHEVEEYVRRSRSEPELSVPPPAFQKEE